MDLSVQIVFWITIVILIGFIGYELMPASLTEGFVVPVGDSKFWAKMVPRRGDVGPDKEQAGYICDKRYFSGYVDVQRFGQKQDYCRIVEHKNSGSKFLACALGGTENLSSVNFRSAGTKEGFKISRDDYMRDLDGDGRFDYCRILKQPSGAFEAKCSKATEKGFRNDLVTDTKPPKEIEMLLEFYAGCVFWLRLYDDMVDYAENLYVNVAGGAVVKENPPRPDKTYGLELNGSNQFVRIGDDPYLNFGSTIQLRNVRAFHFWVRFDEFTNNAHIFDFGNGAGIDNVWCGILFRGNEGIDMSKEKSLLCSAESTVPDAPSGAQLDEEVTPQELMRTTSANVEEFTCEGFAVAPKLINDPYRSRAAPKNLARNRNDPVSKGIEAKTADMVYEIWDKDQRKMRLIVPSAFTLNKWTHVVITAVDTKSLRPDLVIYINGEKAFAEPSGWLPQTNITEKNYIGKSNWTDATSPYANKDELFRGSIFDFRAYVTPLAPKVVGESYWWGRKKLGL
jgi:glycosyltransferase involved in cell wall biosynthesis